MCNDKDPSLRTKELKSAIRSKYRVRGLLLDFYRKIVQSGRSLVDWNLVKKLQNRASEMTMLSNVVQ